MCDQELQIGACELEGGNDLDQRFQQVLAEIDEKLEIDTLAQMVEHLGFRDHLNQRLRQSFGSLRQSAQYQNESLKAIQSVLRELFMDVALLKRALTSLGQVGVMERRKIEKELIRELFPPGQMHSGMGISVASLSRHRTEVDCSERLPICKAACCRIWNVPLTADEVQEDRFEWNPRIPYVLHKNRLGCIHLNSGDCSCSIYDACPCVCSSYSCKNDKRIWFDYDKKILNGSLKHQLAPLHTNHAGQMAAKPLAAEQPEADETWCQKPEVVPPDFSKLREMIVPEPAKKFVPPPAEEPETTEASVVDPHGDGQVDVDEC